MIPFFAQTYLQKRAKQSARLAEIAVNLIGIVNLLLHIFLRSNAARAAIRPWKSSPSKERPLRVFGPSDLEMTMLITSPVLLEEEAERLHVNDNHNLADKLRGPSHPANNTDPIDKGIGPIPEHAQSSMSCDRLRRPPQDENDHPQIVVHPSPFPRRQNSSYSIFPTFRSAMLRNSTSTTFSQGSEEQSLQPPRSIFTLPSSHSRDMSQQTSATVQIGFRLSAFSDERSSPSSFRSSTTTNNNSLRLPLYARTHSAEASPSVSPLSAICRTRIPSTISTSGDSATLPWHIMSPSHLQNERLRRSILGHLSPRTRSRREVGSERLGSSTMKALPPDPPMEVRLKPSAEF